jgi:hypothetical protein
VDRDAVRRGNLADLLRREAVHLERSALAGLEGHVRADEQAAQPLELGRADEHDLLRGEGDEVVDGGVRDQLAAPDHDQVVGGERHLAHQVAGDEDGAALGGERLEQVADPVDPLRVEAVDRLVEDQGARVAQERGRDPEPLAHAEREGAGALACDLVQADEVDQLVDAALRDPVRLREREQVVVGGAAGVHRARLEQRPDLVQRRGMVAVVAAVDGDVPVRGRVEAEDQAHRRRLARAVRAEEAGHHAGLDREGEAVDGALVPVILRQPARFDHVPKLGPEHERRMRLWCKQPFTTQTRARSYPGGHVPLSEERPAGEPRGGPARTRRDDGRARAARGAGDSARAALS